MLVFYVIGLPVAAFLRVRSMHQTSRSTAASGISRRRTMTALKPKEEKIYGMFYTAFRKDTWWWESTVAARKICVALIGVCGAEMGDMQVHLTLMLVVFILLVTSQVRPFGGLKHGVLHVLEMASLMVSILVVSSSFFFGSPQKLNP
jgi:hypothetical protein